MVREEKPMSRSLLPAVSAIALLAIVPGCTGLSQTATVLPAKSFALSPATSLRGHFRHVVIVVQENRTPDNLFNGLPGADTVPSGFDSKGDRIVLRPVRVNANYDIAHGHGTFKLEYDGGKLDGFDRVYSRCSGPCPPEALRPYGYVPRALAYPYFAMATRYAFGDRMFQTNQGPSFPAHQYIISGTATPARNSTLIAAENPLTSWKGTTGGCDSPPSTLVKLIDPQGREAQKMFPCFERPTIFDELSSRGLTWRYYQAHAGSGLWNGVDAIRHLRYASGYASNVVYPPSRFLLDTAAGNLASVTVVTPTADDSDHGQITDGTGPSWVAQVVNAVGKSPDWNDTAIFITWDDWGGWYDHVVPPVYNSYELGFRVPLIVISPYTHSGYVSHRQHEFGSILKFVEENFGLDSLGATDVRADDLGDCFDFTMTPRTFVPIPAPKPAAAFLREPISNQDPDDDAGEP
jgi:phospholipase C